MMIEDTELSSSGTAEDIAFADKPDERVPLLWRGPPFNFGRHARGRRGHLV